MASVHLTAWHPTKDLEFRREMHRIIKILKLIKRFFYNKIANKITNSVRLLDSNTKYKFRKFVVLDVKYPGLGDSLMFSTLPEEFWRQFGKFTKISQRNKFRNPEIYQLIWGDNPYVKGTTKARVNAGHLKNGVIPNLLNNQNAIRNVEIMHGLIQVNEFPKIYYQPKKIEFLNDRIICDLSSVTLKRDINNRVSPHTYNFDLLSKKFLEIRSKYSSNKLHQVIFSKMLTKAEQQHSISAQEIVGLKVENLLVENIYQYCDYIFSSKAMICLYSGQAALSSAVKSIGSEVEINCLIPEFSYKLDSKRSGFLFNNVNFVVF